MEGSSLNNFHLQHEHCSIVGLNGAIIEVFIPCSSTTVKEKNTSKVLETWRV